MCVRAVLAVFVIDCVAIVGVLVRGVVCNACVCAVSAVFVCLCVCESVCLFVCLCVCVSGGCGACSLSPSHLAVLSGSADADAQDCAPAKIPPRSRANPNKSSVAVSANDSASVPVSASVSLSVSVSARGLRGISLPRASARSRNKS